MLVQRAIPATADRDRIRSFLDAIFAPADVFEVRVLGLPRRRSDKPATAAGWFKGSQMELAADAIVHFAPTASGVYVTPQLLRPETYTRHAGKPELVKRNADGTKRPALTSDQDVSAHRYLIIDIDPVRPEGFATRAATDAEKELARGVADNVRSFFSSHHWAEPLIGDSGNGYHLYYRLPAVGSDPICSPQLRDVLKGLGARFNTNAATVDSSVFNPSRIMKALGAPSRKGPDTADRPHRGSGIIGFVPSAWAPARYVAPDGTPSPTGLLDLIAELPRPEKPDKPIAPTSTATKGHTVPSDPAKLAKRVRAYLAKVPPAISGRHGHDRTFEVAQALVNGFCLSRDQAVDFMMTDFVPMSPPDDRWTLSDIHHKVDEAIRNPCDKERGWLLNASRDPRYSSPPATLTHPAVPMTASDEASATTPAVAQGRALPRIVQHPAQFRDVVNQALDALVRANDPMTLFVHADCLSRIDTLAKGGAVKALSQPQLLHLLSKSADWFNETTAKDGEVSEKPVIPKREVVEVIRDHTGWPGLPRLKAVVDVPVFTAESGLLKKSGFDADSGVYLLPSGYASVPAVSDHPAEHEVRMARTLILDDLLGDFPFVDEASRANALALFVLPFVRELIDGPTPLHHIDAPKAGTGKSLLAETWGAVALGRELPSFGEVSRPDDWQKLLLAALMDAPRSIFLDNLNCTLASGQLASTLTSPAVSGRLLGFTRIVSAPVRCIWLSSANNVSMSDELIRRTLSIRMDANSETPHIGRTYRHKLPRWAEVNRGDLVWAILTLCQAWFAAGRPPGRELLGKFESWSAVVDGILTNCGITSLHGNRDTFRSGATDEEDNWSAFVELWWERFGISAVSAKDLYPLAAENDMLKKARGDRAEDSQRSKLGTAIKDKRDSRFGNLKILEVGKHRKGSNCYRLACQTPGPGPDVSDTLPPEDAA